MLIRNGSNYFQNPGTLTGDLKNTSGNWVKFNFARMAGGVSQTFGSYSNGKLAPQSFGLPIKDGSISSYTESSGVIVGVVTLTPGLPISASSSCSISVAAATLDKIASLSGSSSCSISVGVADLASVYPITASSSCSISTSASLGGIFDVGVSGTLSISSSASITANAFIDATAGGPTPLSPEGLAYALWNSPISGNTENGTMGGLILDAGGGASPELIAAAVWDELLTTHNLSGSYGEKIQKLLTLSKFLALK